MNSPTATSRVPQTSPQLPKLESPVFFGCRVAGSQPELPLSFEVDDVAPGLSLESLDRWLEVSLAVSPPLGNMGSASDIQSITARVLAVAQELMRAARIPIFDCGRIISVERIQAHPAKRFRIGARVPAVDHLATQY